MDIKLNASRTNMIDKSIKKVIEKNEKNIDNSVDKFCDKDGYIDYFNIAQILTDLNIFIEILKVENKNSKNLNDKYRLITTLKEFKSKIKLIKIKKQKEDELNFLEQLWITFNPNLLKNYKNDENNENDENDENSENNKNNKNNKINNNNNKNNNSNKNNNNNIKIKKEIFSRFLKIIFSPIETSLSELESILNRFIQAAFFNNNNSNEMSYSSSHSNSNLKCNFFFPNHRRRNFFSRYMAIKNTNKKIF